MLSPSNLVTHQVRLYRFAMLDVSLLPPIVTLLNLNRQARFTDWLICQDVR